MIPKSSRRCQIVQANTAEYNGLEANRTITQIAFALLYLGLTLVVLLVGHLDGHCGRRPAGAADPAVDRRGGRCGAGQSGCGGARCAAPTATWPRSSGTFNKMISELKTQRNEILSAKDQIDERRRFSEAVLEGVTAGIIGVDPDGTITIVNRSAEQMIVSRRE